MIEFVLFFYSIAASLMAIGLMVEIRKAANQMTFTQDEIDMLTKKIIDGTFTNG